MTVRYHVVRKYLHGSIGRSTSQLVVVATPWNCKASIASRDSHHAGYGHSSWLLFLECNTSFLASLLLLGRTIGILCSHIVPSLVIA